MHGHYSSGEVGARLAESVCQHLTSPMLNDATTPKLTCGRVTGAQLPGGWTFVFAGTPSAMANPTLEAPEVCSAYCSACYSMLLALPCRV